MSTQKLVICEKPSVAQSIAAVLNAKTHRHGFYEGEGWLVSWCFGHLVELASADSYGAEYKRWSRETLPFIPERWIYEASKDKAQQLTVLRDLMNRDDVESVVCATDAGREGELIFRLVYSYCKCKKPIQRLWISSMEDSAIRNGFANLRDGSEYDSLYRAADCRQKADYVVGINATRLFSVNYGQTLSVGRVQSPTLALIVDREAAVQGFVSEPFYTPEINSDSFTAYGEKLKDNQAAEAIRAACDGRDAVCVSVERKEKSISAPKLYDLTTLQREANRIFGYTAEQTLNCLQSVYEMKAATYPRTDSRYVTEDMADGIPELIETITYILPFIGSVTDINVSQIVNNSGVTDHHAVIPTLGIAEVDMSSLSSGERNILQMIAVRLICATAPAHVCEEVTAVFECGESRFTAKGKTVLRDGWKDFDNAFRAALGGRTKDESDDEDISALPELRKGQIFPSVSASVKEGKTSPPRRYTEDTLLSAMETAGASDMPEDAERRGLGTSATRGNTIEKLIKSGFVERQKKSLIPTVKGINLIAVLPDSVKSPLLTAEWEHQLKAVEKCELTDTEFMDGIAAMTRKLVADHSAPVEEYLALFGAKDDIVKRDVIGLCPRCGNGIIEGPKGFFCSNRSCAFALWKENRFFAAKKKKITKTIAAALLSEGRVFISDLYSEKTDKTYGATILLDDDNPHGGERGKYVSFKLEFEGRANK